MNVLCHPQGGFYLGSSSYGLLKEHACGQKKLSIFSSQQNNEAGKFIDASIIRKLAGVKGYV